MTINIETIVRLAKEAGLSDEGADKLRRDLELYYEGVEEGKRESNPFLRPPFVPNQFQPLRIPVPFVFPPSEPPVWGPMRVTCQDWSESVEATFDLP